MLFDPLDIHSTEMRSAYALADRLSECVAFQQIAEKTTALAARDRINIGVIFEPLEESEYTIEELENDMTMVRIARLEGVNSSAVLGASLTECPYEGGSLEVYLRRQVRQSELNEVDGRDDVLRFFWDRMAAMPQQILKRVSLSPDAGIRVLTADLLLGPFFGTFEQSVTQGDYIWATLSVEWGNLDFGGS